jgi:hypothetical protein
MSPPVIEALLDEKETYFIARVLLVVGDIYRAAKRAVNQ